MERVERIEDLDVRGFRAQGTVDAGGRIPICTASFQPVVCFRIDRAGFDAAGDSSSPVKC
jgi:hypothetical protein